MNSIVLVWNGVALQAIAEKSRGLHPGNASQSAPHPGPKETVAIESGIRDSLAGSCGAAVARGLIVIRTIV